MNDHDINKAIAELQGWHVDWRDPATGRWYGNSPLGLLFIENDRMPVPDVVNDDFAWGKLFRWLQADGLNPQLIGSWPAIPMLFTVVVISRFNGKAVYEDPKPGRALAVATLKAYKLWLGEVEKQ